jgi:hypothetical protein
MIQTLKDLETPAQALDIGLKLGGGACRLKRRLL